MGGGGGGVGGGNGGVEGTWKAVGDLSRGAAEKGGGGSSDGGGNGGSSTSSSSEEDSSVAKDDGKCHHGLVLDVATAQLDAATSSLDDDDGGGASALATSLSSSIDQNDEYGDDYTIGELGRFGIVQSLPLSSRLMSLAASLQGSVQMCDIYGKSNVDLIIPSRFYDGARTS